MSHNHSHRCKCEHEQVKFCKHCNTVYCLNCSQEWGKQAYTYWPSIGPYLTSETLKTGYLQQLASSGTDEHRIVTGSIACSHKG